MNQGFDQSFTLLEIASRSGVSSEKLRYVFDAIFLPGNRWFKKRAAATSPGRGIPRQFIRREAMALVATALLLEGGVRRRVARELLDFLGSWVIVPGSTFAGDILWSRMLHDVRVVAVEIGDALNIRLVVEDPWGRSRLPKGWIQPRTKATLPDYEPLVTLRLNLTKLRKCFC